MPLHDQEFKVSSQDRTQKSKDVDSHTASNVRPKYRATQRVKKVI